MATFPASIYDRWFLPPPKVNIFVRSRQLDSQDDRQRSFALALAGQTDGLGTLLKLYCTHLRILAESQLDPRLRARVSPSDVVQETLFEAHCGFAQFRGTTEGEFAAWLRRILANNLARAFERHVLAEKRDVHREVAMDEIGASLERSAARFHDLVADDGMSPSSHADRHERLLAVSAAMANLSEDHRQVMIWRHLDGLAFAEIATRLGRSAGACRMLWLRAVEQLRQALAKDGWS